MNGNKAKKYLLSKPGALEDYPFGPDVMVPKIKGKMFATLAMRNDTDSNPAYRSCARINLKCNPDEVMALRDIFEAVQPGYHMNKTHWNTVILDGSIPVSEIQRMIDRSFGLVVKGLKKADRVALELKYGEDALYL